MTTMSPTGSAPTRLSVARCALTGAISLIVLFAICWLGAFVAPQQAHMYIALFTTSPVTSTSALVTGLCWSAVFGVVGGALLALVYNGLGFLDRR